MRRTRHPPWHRVQVLGNPFGHYNRLCGCVYPLSPRRARAEIADRKPEKVFGHVLDFGFRFSDFDPHSAGGVKSAMTSCDEPSGLRVDVHITLVPSGLNTG